MALWICKMQTVLLFWLYLFSILYKYILRIGYQKACYFSHHCNIHGKVTRYCSTSNTFRRFKLWHNVLGTSLPVGNYLYMLFLEFFVSLYLYWFPCIYVQIYSFYQLFFIHRCRNVSSLFNLEDPTTKNFLKIHGSVFIIYFLIYVHSFSLSLSLSPSLTPSLYIRYRTTWLW